MGSSGWPLLLVSIPSDLVVTPCTGGVPLLRPSAASRPSTLSCKEIGPVTTTLGTLPSLQRPSSWRRPSCARVFAPLANLGAPDLLGLSPGPALPFGSLSLGFAFGCPELEFPGGTQEFRPNSVSSCSAPLLSCAGRPVHLWPGSKKLITE
jgi:hypothetical protein